MRLASVDTKCKVSQILRIDLNIFAFLVTIVLMFSSQSRNERKFMDYMLFRLMTWGAAIELVLDTLMWLFDGCAAGPGRLALVSSTFLYYALHPFAPMCYTLFTIQRISTDARRVGKLARYLAPPFAASVLLSAASLWTGWYFFVDAAGNYRHGPLFQLFAAFSYGYFIAACCFLIEPWRRKAIEARTLASLFFFPILPSIAGILQMRFFGLVLIWPAMTLSLLFIYVNLQQRKLSVDYLTGVFNRRRLDEYLEVCTRDRGAAGSRGPGFRSLQKARRRRRSDRSGERLAGFLMDVDDFKSINDRLGHAQGDAALVDAVRILRMSLRSDDFLARYAGDEFVAVFYVADEEELKAVVERVRAQVEGFSREGRPYRLSFSLGAAFFDPELDVNADKFVERLDSLMYEEKAAKKQSRQGLAPGMSPEANNPRPIA